MDFLKLIPKGKIVDVANAMLDGADINFADRLGSTALHLASKQRSVEIVQLLILRKANINAQNIFGWTSLHLAVYNRKQQNIKLLEEAGIDKTIRDFDGRTAYEVGARNVNLMTARLFLWRPEYH